MKVRKMNKSGTKLRNFRKNAHNLEDIVMILESEKNCECINIKHNTEYYIIGEIINATNDSNGQKMILYTDGKGVYAREVEEFNEKFLK